METKEFIKKVEDLGYEIIPHWDENILMICEKSEENPDFEFEYEYEDEWFNILATIHVDKYSISVYGVDFALFSLCCEYAKTPLSER